MEIRIEINPLDLVRNGDSFTFKQGQTLVFDEFVVEDGGELIIPDLASVISAE